MRMSEVYADHEAFMASRTFEVEHVIENLVNAAKDAADLRLINEARAIMMTDPCMLRLQTALDALQITCDDLEGKRCG